MSCNHSTSLKKIGVYTSGGDSPGMNAAIRSVVRSALHFGIEVIGIKNGYNGMISNDFISLGLNDVSNIIQRAGTILRTGRSKSFLQFDVRANAASCIAKQGIDSLVCIGGDGSFTGAYQLSKEHNIPIVGIPGTIDNDLYGTDETIGFDTAVNTALEAIDRIRDTAASLDRLFIIEVMGHNSGHIALAVALSGGAEEVFIPETNIGINETILKIKKSTNRGKKSSILVTAEGKKPGRAYDLADILKRKEGWESRVCVLGHIQRGGAPTANDRILASKLGSYAIDCLRSGQTNAMVGVQNGQLVCHPLSEVLSKTKQIDKSVLDLIHRLSN